MPINPRVRDNNVFGTTDDNPLTAGATSFNSSGLINLSVVAAKHAVITLDPLRQYGNPEIIIVTSHTVSATIATITRGAYNTTARAHPQGTLWVHAPLDEDFIEIVTSITRPSDPYEGQFIFETDTNKLYGYGGVDWAPRDAGGQIGYSQAIVSQTGITAITDLTNLSVAVTVGTGRRIKISGHGGYQRSVADGLGRFIIREGTTVLTFEDYFVRGAAEGQIGMAIAYVTTPTAGVHTYKLSLQQVTGTGTSSFSCDATSPGFILVQDIGAA